MNDQFYENISIAQRCLSRVEELKEQSEKAGLLEKAKIADSAISKSVEMSRHMIYAMILMAESIEEVKNEQ